MVVFGGGKKPSQGGAGPPAFADIVGQERFKQALLVVAADDDLDGLLVRGEKGTAKSTGVRALAGLLPVQSAVADCLYGCHPTEPSLQCADCRERTDPPTTERPVPLVTLPLGATRDRVVGTLSMADALDGDPEFEPGLLARAHRGILYVDEVNLLDDHLVDVLLEAAASGVNRVERDGVSVVHPASFTLVGTMNPEEGDLRPQLRDRFALQVTVTGCQDVDDRVTIIERALDGDANVGAAGDHARTLLSARNRLDDVDLPESLAAEVATLCRDAGVDGHRGDIATARAARALAALDGRTTVIETDVQRAAELALPHRFESRPFEDAPDPAETIAEHFESDADDAGDDRQPGQDERAGEGGDDAADGESRTDHPDGRGDGEGESGAEATSERDPASSPGTDQRSEAASDETDRGEDDRGTDDGEAQSPTTGGRQAPDARDDKPTDDGPTAGDSDDGSTDAGSDDGTAGSAPLVPGQDRIGVGESSAPDLDRSASVDAAAGRRGGSDGVVQPTTDADGPRIRSTRTDSASAVDPAATVRATARRGGDAVTDRDLRRSVRGTDGDALVVFVVDASASMRPAMRAAKGTVLELLKDAYQHRDEVAFVAVAGDSASVVLPPTDSVTLAARHLKDLPTGDRTPLPDGLRTARDVVDRAGPAACTVVLVTDGRANVADGSPTERTRTAAAGLAETGADVVVVKAGDGVGVTDVVLEATDGVAISLSSLTAERVDATLGTQPG